jgi:hypothetical protein
MYDALQNLSIAIMGGSILRTEVNIEDLAVASVGKLHPPHATIEEDYTASVSHGVSYSLTSGGTGGSAIQDLYRPVDVRYAEEESGIARFIYSGITVIDVYVDAAQLRGCSCQLAGLIRETDLRDLGFIALDALGLNDSFSRGGVVHDKSNLSLAGRSRGMKSQDVHSSVGKRLADLPKSTWSILNVYIEFFGPWHSRPPPAENVSSDLLTVA